MEAGGPARLPLLAVRGQAVGVQGAGAARPTPTYMCGRRGATQSQAEQPRASHRTSSLAQLSKARPASDVTRSMAEPRAATIWELLEQLDAELQWAILDLAGALAAKHLRGASREARALVNSRVERIRLPADALATLPLRLHARFPRLARLELAPGALNSDAFADFAVAELARLSLLVELHLRHCGSLGTAAAVVLRDCCPQLQALDLAGTGAWWGKQPPHVQHPFSLLQSRTTHRSQHPLQPRRRGEP